MPAICDLGTLRPLYSTFKETLMRLDITGTNLFVTDALRAYAERRIRFAIGRCSHRLQDIYVIFTDINGPRGGNDKQCKIRAVLAPRGYLVMNERNKDFYTTIDCVTRRLKRAVSRHANYWPKNRRHTV